MRVGVEGRAALVALGLFADRLADHLHVLFDPPVVVLAELLQADDAGGGHGHGRLPAAFRVGELPVLLLLFFLGRVVRDALGRVVLAHAADRHFDDLRRDFQAAIDRAPQGLGLHHRQAQVVPAFLRAGLIVPAAVAALRLRDELQAQAQHVAELLVVLRAVMP